MGWKPFHPALAIIGGVEKHAPERAARLEDVARAAGVALVTASRALNHPQQVAPETLARVQAAVAALGYVPNLTAGSLASQKSRIVAAIVPTVANTVFSEMVEGLGQALAAGGHQLLLGQSAYRDGDEARLVDTFLGRRADGLVLTGSEPAPALRERLRHAAVPVVQTWSLSDDPLDMQVGFDHRAAGATVAQALLARGHRVLGFIGADEPRSRQRLDGLRVAAEAGGGSVIAELMHPPVQADDVGPALRRLRRARPELQAVLGNNDLIAAAALFECARQGWRVPQDLAIAALGDGPLASACWPRLSALRVPGRLIGERAGQLLLARLRGEAGAVRGLRVDVGTEWVARDST